MLYDNMFFFVCQTIIKLDIIKTMLYTNCTIYGSTVSITSKEVPMFQIDSMSRTPVYEQIISQLERFVLKGILTTNDQLPSVRSLSMELSINPNTIQKAYSELDRKGMIYSVPGKGCFVSEKAFEVLSKSNRGRLSELEKFITELAYSGLAKTEIIDCVEEAYRKKGESQ